MEKRLLWNHLDSIQSFRRCHTVLALCSVPHSNSVGFKTAITVSPCALLQVATLLNEEAPQIYTLCPAPGSKSVE